MKNSDNADDINYDNTILIYSKSLCEDLVVPKWNNRSMDLKQAKVNELEGYKIFMQKIANQTFTK